MASTVSKIWSIGCMALPDRQQDAVLHYRKVSKPAGDTGTLDSDVRIGACLLDETRSCPGRCCCCTAYASAAAEIWRTAVTVERPIRGQSKWTSPFAFSFSFFVGTSHVGTIQADTLICMFSLQKDMSDESPGEVHFQARRIRKEGPQCFDLCRQRR